MTVLEQFLKNIFILATSTDPYETHNMVLHCLQKYPFMGFKDKKEFYIILMWSPGSGVVLDCISF